MHIEELGRVRRVGVRRVPDRLLEGGDAIGRQRMRRQVGVASADQHALVPLQVAQELQRSLGRLPGALQEGDRRLVSRALLSLAVVEEGEDGAWHRRLAGAGRSRPAAAAAAHGAARQGAGAQDHLQDLHGAEVVQLFLHAREMAAGDVAGLVRQHADQLVRRLGAHDQAGVDKDALAARHEGIERVVLDDHDLDRVGVEAGRLPDRRHEGPDGVLDLGVADQIEALTLLRLDGTKRRQRQQRETEEGEDAFGHGGYRLQAG